MHTFRWAPPIALVVIGWLGAAAAAFWCVAGTSDATGRLLAGVTVLVLASAALFGSWARPRLAASPTGLAIRGVGGPVRYEWEQVSRVRLVHTRRFGRDVASLESRPGAPEMRTSACWCSAGWTSAPTPATSPTPWPPSATASGVQSSAARSSMIRSRVTTIVPIPAACQRLRARAGA